MLDDRLDGVGNEVRDSESTPVHTARAVAPPFLYHGTSVEHLREAIRCNGYIGPIVLREDYRPEIQRSVEAMLQYECGNTGLVLVLDTARVRQKSAPEEIEDGWSVPNLELDSYEPVWVCLQYPTGDHRYIGEIEARIEFVARRMKHRTRHALEMHNSRLFRSGGL